MMLSQLHIASKYGLKSGAVMFEEFMVILEF